MWSSPALSFGKQGASPTPESAPDRPRLRLIMNPRRVRGCLERSRPLFPFSPISPPLHTFNPPSMGIHRPWASPLRIPLDGAFLSQASGVLIVLSLRGHKEYTIANAMVCMMSSVCLRPCGVPVLTSVPGRTYKHRIAYRIVQRCVLERQRKMSTGTLVGQCIAEMRTSPTSMDFE
jgi:hypothetical protein